LATNLSWMTAPASLAATTIEAGTVLPVKLNDTLSSKDSRNGDSFSATIRTDESSYYNNLPVGTKIEGTVRQARAQQDKDPGVLDLAFKRIRLPNGRSYPIEGSLIGLDNKSVTKTSDGRIVAKPGKGTDRLTYVGYGAGAGLLVSLFTKQTLSNTLLGAGLGYLFGSLQKSHNDPRDVTLKPGTEMGVRLDRRLTLSGYTSDESQDTSSSANTDRYHKTQEGNRATDNNGSQDVNREVNSASSDSVTNIGVLVGDQDVSFDSTARPVMANNTVLVPFHPVLNAAHVNFKYDAGAQRLTALTPNGSVRLTAGSRIAVVNGSKRVRMEAPAQRLNGTLYVPLKFLSLATGQNATWDSGSRTVVIAPKD